MSALHDALTNLGPIEFADVPTDDLSAFLKEHFEAGELICNSVPLPDGDEFESSTPSFSEPDSASSSKEVKTASARPPRPHASHADLQSTWGKPYKLSTKDNPLGVSVYKTAGHDRHGAWFARRSVHEGVSFSKFRAAMRWEFSESLAVTGGPGVGNVRGIGGDKRLEKKQVDGVGQMEVYQLSAQFPGPTTPREFVTLLLTSDHALSEKSAADGNSQKVPRHYMVLSRPVKHPEAPEKSGYIRGQYESVELIREIPLHHASGKSASTTDLLSAHDSSTGRARGSTIASPESRGPDAKGEKVDQKKQEVDPVAELNPVEWIMITRSDPGGGIPRFMVERGTPGSIATDVCKFLDWACAKKDIPNPDDESAEPVAAPVDDKVAKTEPAVDGQADRVTTQPTEQPQPPPGGIMSHLTNALEAGFEQYAPTSVSNVASQYLNPGENKDEPSEEDSSDDSDSYASADESHSAINVPAASTDSIPISRSSSPESKSNVSINRHDKEVDKLGHQEEKLEQKLAKKRQTEAEKLKAQQERDTSEQQKATEKHDKEIKKTEERHAREIAKLQHKKEKELKKAEEKRKKQMDRDTLSRVSRERDEFRDQADKQKKANELLRDTIGELQKENTLLVQKLSKTPGGESAMRAIRDEIKNSSRSRASSVKSQGSGSREK